MTTTKATNRALTLAGANKIFEAIGLEIKQHELGYYHCDCQGHEWKHPTLTGLCRSLVKEHFQALTSDLPKPQLWATATKPDPATAALTCITHSLKEASLIPGAEEDWDLAQAIALLTQAQEHLQSYQHRGS
ncbi:MULTISPECIES: hypothetical protein [Cyanophyceae]|uniref:hypothetical protein n=1 Tax=Cyanophyceae TaxID=3028117 RepID=UPI001687FD53|nr:MULTISPECIES: hypothetical protein [Cyanophyceae]MBD1918892.1 hypothetical protein [Phormidium sp. FACHB-77]MBD2033266.1 hypothetical protein [Phormidium sp. FACHB-322]MBD2053801.1 hypothetical protein [Leptolyngbya sp. FACHB-60]